MQLSYEYTPSLWYVCMYIHRSKFLNIFFHFFVFSSAALSSDYPLQVFNNQILIHTIRLKVPWHLSQLLSYRNNKLSNKRRHVAKRYSRKMLFILERDNTEKLIIIIYRFFVTVTF